MASHKAQTEILREMRGWVAQAHLVLETRRVIHLDGDRALSTLRERTIALGTSGSVAWRILPLSRDDLGRLTAIARFTQLAPLTPDEQDMIQELTTEIADMLAVAAPSHGIRRLLMSPRARADSHTVMSFLIRYFNWGRAEGLEQWLKRLQPVDIPCPELNDILEPWIGLFRHLANFDRAPVLSSISLLENVGEAASIVVAAASSAEARLARVRETSEAVRMEYVANALKQMPVTRLQEATRDRVRVSPLVDGGFVTVWDVLANSRQVWDLPGVGPVTAERVIGAAQTLRQTIFEETPVRIDLQQRGTSDTDLIRALAELMVVRSLAQSPQVIAEARTLRPLRRLEGAAFTHVLVAGCDRDVHDLSARIENVERMAREIQLVLEGRSLDAIWADFEQRPSDYFSLLSELGLLGEEEERSHGDLPRQIVEAVRQVELRTDRLRVSLRGYQAFGARFALAQRRVLIGDEMGLGKTIEALAVLSHLASRGGSHFLVICPASVVTNWVREVLSKSTLDAHHVHGQYREYAARRWERGGGVAVTTYDSLGWFRIVLERVGGIEAVVVDEAHYIKNTTATRTQRTRKLLKQTNYAVLLTGTPLENRIDEFQTIIGHIRPDLVVDAHELAPRRFRAQVAPAYLRRNQEDVLLEIPELVENDEWLPMSHEDEVAYRDAVASGNFMQMRQAAMISGRRSIKLSRLLELVSDAQESGRKVIVFSYFLEVLHLVATTLPGQVFGPLTGALAAGRRQEMVDAFSKWHGGAVLVAQITAGGVGLNIQAATVVIFCEPQLKPTTEWQAVARARRMGQVKTVQVYRLLSEVGVDRRITEILARKAGLFDDFARVSNTAASAPEFVDISEGDLARQVIAEERQRLHGSAPPKDAQSH